MHRLVFLWVLFVKVFSRSHLDVRVDLGSSWNRNQALLCLVDLGWTRVLPLHYCVFATQGDMLLIQSRIPTNSFPSKLVWCKVEFLILFSSARWVEKLLLKLVVNSLVKWLLSLCPIVHGFLDVIDSFNWLRADLFRFIAASVQFPLCSIMIEQDLAGEPLVNRLSPLIYRRGHLYKLFTLNSFLLAASSRSYFFSFVLLSFMKLFILARNMFDLKVFFANRRLVERVYTIATTLLVTKMGATLILRLARIIIVKQWGQTLTMGFSATS